MKATARRVGTYRHEISIRQHGLAADEPTEHGGGGEGPPPPAELPAPPSPRTAPQELLAASLASCTAITMEMYAQRKGWVLDDIEVSVDYQPAERGCPTR